MNDIYFKLITSKSDKSGKCPVRLHFYFDSQVFVYSTKEKSSPGQWDFEKEKFRKSYPGYAEANEGLEILRDKIRSFYRTLKNTGQLVTPEALRSFLNDEQPAKKISVDLVPIFAEYIKFRKAEGYKKGTIGSMSSSLSRLKRFVEAGHSLQINAYTNIVHRALLNYLLEEDLNPSSISNVCKHLLTFFTHCKDILKLELHADHAKITKKHFPSDRIFLTEADLSKIESIALPPRLDRVRDSFLFQCYTGLRYKDLWRLEYRHVEEREGYKVISLIPEKSVSRKATKVKRIEVPLLPGAIKVLNRYDGDYRLLPVLSNQKMNDYVKEVAQLAGLADLVETVDYVKGVPQLIAVEKWKRVTSHMARHTFATLSLLKGVPLEVVSKALGHENISTTLVYAKIVDEYKNQAILKAWHT